MNILDLFCGGGGAARGMIDAGCHVTGVDIKKSAGEYYPGTFLHANAMKILSWRTLSGSFLEGFDLIWASPPCQGWSTVTQRWINQDPAKYAKKYPVLIPRLREILKHSGKPFIIENVPNAPLEHPIKLCGLMFGLALYRHRHFECSFPVAQPAHVKHDGQQPFSVYGNPRSNPKQGEVYAELVKSWPDQMGLYHIPPGSRFFAEAIPPAFSKYLIEQYSLNKRDPSPSFPLEDTRGANICTHDPTPPPQSDPTRESDMGDFGRDERRTPPSTRGNVPDIKQMRNNAGITAKPREDKTRDPSSTPPT